MQRARTRGVVRGWKGTNPRTMRAALSGSYRRNGGAWGGRQANDDRVGIKQGGLKTQWGARPYRWPAEFSEPLDAGEHNILKLADLKSLRRFLDANLYVP